MVKKTGAKKAPLPADGRTIEMRVMLNAEEAKAFRAEAAKVATPMSTWARMRLRQVAGL